MILQGPKHRRKAAAGDQAVSLASGCRDTWIWDAFGFPLTTGSRELSMMSGYSSGEMDQGSRIKSLPDLLLGQPAFGDPG